MNDIVEVSKLLRIICINAKSYVRFNFSHIDRDNPRDDQIYITDMTFRSNNSYLYIQIICILELNTIPYTEKKIRLPNSRYSKYVIEINI